MLRKVLEYEGKADPSSAPTSRGLAPFGCAQDKRDDRVRNDGAVT